MHQSIQFKLNFGEQKIINYGTFIFDQIYSAISENEKSEIKALLMSHSFKEPIPQIAIQMAVLIGNISRFDYPHDWNEVINCD